MKNSLVRKNKYLVVSIIIVLLVTLMPVDGKMAGNHLDKVGHFLIFFILSVNVSYKYQDKRRLIDALFLAISFGFVTEFLQQFIPGRNMEIYDAMADTLGVIVGYYSYVKFQTIIDRNYYKLRA